MAQAAAFASNNGNGSSSDVSKNHLEKRGSELAFKSIVTIYNSHERLQTIVPEVVNQPLSQIKIISDLLHSSAALNSDELTQISRLDLDANLGKYQELVSNLNLVEYLCTLDELSPCIMKKYLGSRC